MYKRKLILVGFCLITSLVFGGCTKNQISNKYISLKSYENVKIENKQKLEVTDEDIDNYIEEVRLRNSEERKVIDESVQEGDIVNIDFRGMLNGKEFEGGTEKGYIITVGLGGEIEGFDESIIGHLTGDVFEFKGKFPKDYYDEGYAGESVVFEIKVNSINRQEIPEFNDDFVKTVSDTSQTVEEYKKEVRKILEEGIQLESQLEDEIWQSLMEKTIVKNYPKKEVKKQKNKIKEEYKKIAESYDMAYKDFVKSEMQCTEEEFDSQIEQQAEIEVKEKLLVDAISEQEKIYVPEENEFLLEELMQENGFESEEILRTEIGKNGLKDLLLKETVKDWLVENATVDF